MFGKRIKNKITKIYIDLEPSYNGNETGYAMFNNLNDWNASIGMFGILKIEFDIKKKTKRQIYFKQILNPNIECFEKLLFEDDVDMIVTWNGRKFDIPLIINLFSLDEKEQYNNKIKNIDRDLIDVCSYKKINIKGGIGEVIKRLNIGINTEEKDVSLHKFFNSWDTVFRSDDSKTEEYKKALNIVKGRNKFDCESLVLLEEKLSLSYELKLKQDFFSIDWKKNNMKKRTRKISNFLNKNMR